MRANKLSVIVPVYNEENYIGTCLEALLEQGEDVAEILVVNNNSTDSTVSIVESFVHDSAKITLIDESQRGVAFARNAGFDAASHDILGRIDADSRVCPGWARTVIDYFDREDTAQVGAATGLNNSYDSPFRSLKGWFVEKQVSRGVFGGERKIQNIHGANMAIRRSTWLNVRDSVSVRPDIHEDVDLALCIVGHEIQIAQLTDMRIDMSPRRALTPPREFTKYIDSGTKTFDLHGKMTPAIERALRIHWAWHVLLFALHKPYDTERGRYSLRHVLDQNRARGLPIDMSR